MFKKKSSGRSLEREVITAVVTLYIIICVGLLAVHYAQPADQCTATSSTSPSAPADCK
ncbi:hypothetical protein AB0M43_07155 [Longispora sp. NPDC051575]|uniref:hypothetical protein n=1 Tax=Longispora sp. NPDC051575 TaxID=3154943 RepID=UPI003430FBBD